ncbi:hypothetical protein LOZ39_002647 [Ophidiomyces ophidiicola]|nr:hypothetical protein LOZ61_003772 [Ophidiomyces ophidiicola]KAI1921106.1 hypothetical protein LOZ60_006364 [Ophidiomyces ophidiicola]KAI1965724.1 hypothetical protein LOZ56_005983 [Ophidiomyces ophidiicola]KAI2024288.1 hypothetical protein LOZ45_003609 [Ophidiomyces ophidiicola]KAI2042400.1 hypothetical protein LOZ44_006140 [Ophidiomyces ophidiicola]
MSAPTRKLGKLSIGSMAGGQPQRQTRQTASPYEARTQHESDTEAESSSSDEEAQGPAQTTVVRGSTNFPFDIGGLSQAARSRAVHGLRGEFVMDKCRSTRAGFEFDVADRGRIRLSDGSLACSCRDFQQTELACRHIYWLVDQLHGSFSARAPPHPGRLQETGQTQFFARVAEKLESSIEEIAKSRDWPYLPGSMSPPDISDDELELMSRPEKARDILSAFSEATLPNEFRLDLVETINQSRTPEQCVVQGDFEATMFRLAVHDEKVYSGLRKVMPSGARADIFFEKVAERLRALFVEFDRYRQTGVVRRNAALEIPVLVVQINARLKQIQDNIRARHPHGAISAAEALMHLFREVVARNNDAFENSDWGRRAPAGETDDDRNLYKQLIDQTGHAETFFILDCLETLPDHILRELSPELGSLASMIHVNGASIPYQTKLQALRTADRSGGRKRPATGTAAIGGKRTR